MNCNLKFWSISEFRDFREELPEYKEMMNELDRIQISDNVDLTQILPVLWQEIYQHKRDLPLRIMLYDTFDVAVFEQMPMLYELENLNIETSWGILNLEKLANFKYLKTLVLDFGSKKEGTDLSFMSALNPDLQVLHIEYAEKNTKTDLLPLAHFKNLKFLSIKCMDKNLEKILPEFTKLTDLRLRSVGKPKNLDCIKDLTHLQDATLQLCGFENVDVLATLKNIRYLQLWRLPKLTNLDFVSQMSGLQFLFVETLNGVTKFPKVSDLQKLRRVKITSCKNIADFSEVANAKSIEDFAIQNAKQEDLMIFLPIIENQAIKRLGIGYEKVATQNELLALAQKHGREKMAVYMYPDFENFVFQ